MTFRVAAENDCALILSFIRGLAAYEKMADQVVATEELLREWIFEKRKAEVLFVCDGDREAGFALFFHNFSTFLGRAGIYAAVYPAGAVLPLNKKDEVIKGALQNSALEKRRG